MIEVVCVETGDQAEAETPEAALTTARTLRNDAVDYGWCRVNPTLRFYVDGQLVAERKGNTLS